MLTLHQSSVKGVQHRHIPASGRWYRGGKQPKSFYPQILPSKRFLLLYDDRSRSHISTAERDELLILGRITKLDSYRYAYTGQQQTFHSFAELEPLLESVTPIGPFRRFLAGHFIFEHKQRRRRELLETPEGMAIRMQTA